MLNIGTDDPEGLIYEGSGNYGRAVWPSPVLTPAKIVFPSEGPIIAEQSSDSSTSMWRFREDSFDPIARIRRGRFYVAQGNQPAEWYLQPHPALPIELVEANKQKAHIRKSLHTFYGQPLAQKFIDGGGEQPLVLLGRDDRYTIWTIINVERISTGEDLVTLRSRSALGILPHLFIERVPPDFRAHVQESLNAFAGEVYRSSPVSVIDRARDAASQVLLAYFKIGGSDAKDLGDLATRLEQTEKKMIAVWAARIIARLHSRAKPSERARRAMRAVREEDAQLATQCVGIILCELSWADWVSV